MEPYLAKMMDGPLEGQIRAMYRDYLDVNTQEAVTEDGVLKTRMVMYIRNGYDEDGIGLYYAAHATEWQELSE